MNNASTNSDATPLRPTEPAPGSPGPAGNPDTFTPGPWKVFGIRARFATISQADALGRPSRHIAEMSWDNHDEHAPHDAALIAAAPDLLEALEDARGWVWGEARRKRIDAVIAKARGAQ
jgi:hypothetical protein